MPDGHLRVGETTTERKTLGRDLSQQAARAKSPPTSCSGCND